MNLLNLIATCAPLVSQDTMFGIVMTESAGNPLALNIAYESYFPANKKEAVELLEKADAEGKSYAVGLGQIWYENFSYLGLTHETALDPCVNVKAAQTILIDFYKRRYAKTGNREQALEEALSQYFSGNIKQGIESGYTQKVVNNSTIVPSISLLGGNTKVSVSYDDTELFDLPNTTVVTVQESSKKVAKISATDGFSKEPSHRQGFGNKTSGFSKSNTEEAAIGIASDEASTDSFSAVRTSKSVDDKPHNSEIQSPQS
jgi:hypothetical protein